MSELIGRINQDGNIVLPKKRLEEIKLLLKGKKIILSFDEFQPKKSRAQLGYFHKGIIGTLSNVTGIAKKKLRNYFNMKFLPDEAVNPKTGEWTTVPGSTSTLKKYEYSNFINEVYLDCLDMGFHEIKTPEEYWDSIGIQPNQPTDSL
jgi:hypothetical protein